MGKQQNDILSRNDALVADTNRLDAEVLARERRINHHKEEVARQTRFYDNEKKRRIRLESKHSEDRAELDTFQQQMKQMAKEITVFKKEDDKKEKGIADLQRSADMQQKIILHERQNKLAEQEKVSLTERNVSRL